jgi:DNA-binding NarL/FixJ family response regulator
MLKLFIADDHAILIDGLQAILREEPDMQIIGTASDGISLLQQLPATLPDVLLLDLNMPRLDGIHCLQRISKEYPALKVIVLSNYDQPELVKEVQLLGASGYILKNSPRQTLVQTIRLIAAGNTYFQSFHADFTPPASSFFLDDFMRKYQLTRREVEIIRLVCREHTSKEIADHLFISEFTVQTHRRNIMRKLELKNATSLVLFAQEQGLY